MEQSSKTGSQSNLSLPGRTWLYPSQGSLHRHMIPGNRAHPCPPTCYCQEWSCCSVTMSCPTLRAHALQHTRLPWPSASPRVYSNSCPLSQWCHPTISSSVVPYSSCPLSFSASGSFPMSWLFASGGQSIGASTPASVLPMNTQGWFPLGWTGLISLLSKGLSRVFSNTIVQKHQFFSAQPSFWSNSHIHTWLLEKPQLWLYGPLAIWTRNEDSLLSAVHLHAYWWSAETRGGGRAGSQQQTCSWKFLHGIYQERKEQREGRKAGGKLKGDGRHQGLVPQSYLGQPQCRSSTSTPTAPPGKNTWPSSLTTRLKSGQKVRGLWRCSEGQQMAALEGVFWIHGSVIHVGFSGCFLPVKE